MWIITKGRGWKFRLKSLHQEITPAIRQFHFNHFLKIYKTCIILNPKFRNEIILSTCKSQLRGEKSPREMYHRNDSLYICEISLVVEKNETSRNRVVVFARAFENSPPKSELYWPECREGPRWIALITRDGSQRIPSLVSPSLITSIEPLNHRGNTWKGYVQCLFRATRKDTPTGWN